MIPNGLKRMPVAGGHVASPSSAKEKSRIVEVISDPLGLRRRPCDMITGGLGVDKNAVTTVGARVAAFKARIWVRWDNGVPTLTVNLLRTLFVRRINSAAKVSYPWRGRRRLNQLGMLWSI
jgi:hypothetical protein